MSKPRLLIVEDNEELRLQLKKEGYLSRDARGDEDLSRLRLRAEARSEVHDRSHRPVIEASLETDRADSGVALRYTSAEVELITKFAPLGDELCHASSHGERHHDCTLGRVRYWHRIVEKDHHPVASKTLERAFMIEGQLAHFGMVFAKDSHDFLGFSRLRKSGEAPQVQKDNGHVTPVGLEWIFGAAGDDQLSELWRKESFETSQTFQLSYLLLNATLEVFIEIGQLTRLFLNRVMKFFDPKKRFDARKKLGLIDRLGKKIVGARLGSPLVLGIGDDEQFLAG